MWFALVVGDHPHHRPALAWWNEDSPIAGFSRLTQLGVLRLRTTASAMGGVPLSNQDAWAVYHGFFDGQPCASISRIGCYGRALPRLVERAPPFSKIWVDAYLAVLAMANEATLVTFDQAFTQHPVECRILR